MLDGRMKEPHGNDAERKEEPEKQKADDSGQMKIAIIEIADQGRKGL